MGPTIVLVLNNFLIGGFLKTMNFYSFFQATREPNRHFLTQHFLKAEFEMKVRNFASIMQNRGE